MNGFFTEAHQALKDQVRAFAEQEVRPRISSMEESQRVETDLSRKIAQQGWIGITIPPCYGGKGAGHVAKTITIEELARVSAAMGAMVQASQLGVAKVLHFGTEEQKRYWLPLFATGAVLPTIAVTEPSSGGHVLGMQSTATRKGNTYILNGRKWLVGNSHIGDVHGVVVRTGEGSKGLTAFLVERDRPGCRLGRLGGAAGLHGFSYGEIIFENCAVPIENRIGEEGQGMEVAYSSSVLYGRPNLTAVALGIHQAVVEDTVEFCQQRMLYDKPLTHLPSIQTKVGEMYARLQTARLSAYYAVHLLDHGHSCDGELMAAKLMNTESAFTAVKDAIDIFAGRGCLKEYHLERYLRDVLHTFPAAGTSDIQRLRLAQIAFGENKGSWSEKLRQASSLRSGA